ncbi:MAG TPA: hypothetical protein VN903_37365, partial [Polyangia bacterium]|nr:hypothetical protein [Polyangia bacterium]
MRRVAGVAGLVVWALVGCGHVDQDRYAGPKTPIAPGELGKLEGRYAYADPICDGCRPTRVSDALEGHGTFTRGSAQPPPDEKSASVTLAVVDSRHVKLVVLAGGAVWSEQL